MNNLRGAKDISAPSPKCSGFFFFFLVSPPPHFGFTLQLRTFLKENDLKGDSFKIPTNWEISVCTNSSASQAFYAYEEERYGLAMIPWHKE